MRSDTQTVTIQARPKEVLAFVGDGENLPQWAIGFAKYVRRSAGSRWLVSTGQGEVATAITVDEATGPGSGRAEPGRSSVTSSVRTAGW